MAMRLTVDLELWEENPTVCPKMISSAYLVLGVKFIRIKLTQIIYVGRMDHILCYL